MKKVLFIDRDGTIIVEPQDTYQIDSLERLSFIPGVISALHKIARQTDYELVMVTNQDGLGTASFPEETFWPAQDKMLEVLRGEGIVFAQIHIDRSFEHENLPTRKPGLGMLEQYLDGSYDLAGSYVIGDRLTDIQLAQNLGAKAIYISDKTDERAALCTTDWEKIYQFLRLPERKAEVKRRTHETEIEIRLNLDGQGRSDVQTGLGFFDHMLDQLAKHSGADLYLRTQGDLHVDEHHTIEDTAIALGEAFHQALGDKRGVQRYGFLLPMDDVLAQVAIDFSGRSWLVWEAEFRREKIGEMPTEMFYHFFKSFCDSARANLNVKAEGTNEHHKIEAIFKAVAKSIRQAVSRDANRMEIPSTKGIL